MPVKKNKRGTLFGTRTSKQDDDIGPPRLAGRGRKVDVNLSLSGFTDFFQRGHPFDDDPTFPHRRFMKNVEMDFFKGTARQIPKGKRSGDQFD